MNVSNQLRVFFYGLLALFGLGGHVDLPLKEQVGRAVVYVTDPMGMLGGGTGFTVKAPSGRLYIVTNRHVCGLEMGGYVRIRHGEDEPGTLRKVIQKSLAHDLCLVEALPKDHNYLEVSDAPAGKFDRVSAIGHPDLLPLVQEDGQIITEAGIRVTGECEGLKGEEEVEPGVCTLGRQGLIISNKIRPGNSGSPLVNKDGKVVGVIFAGNDFYGIAVPLRYLKAFLARR